jgi:hypothetical protein
MAKNCQIKPLVSRACPNFLKIFSFNFVKFLKQNCTITLAFSV